MRFSYNPPGSAAPNRLNVEQESMVRDAIAACQFRFGDTDLHVVFHTVDEPRCLGHKDYMCTTPNTDTDIAGNVTLVEIRHGAETSTVANVAERDVRAFFMEAVVHEIGHAVTFDRIISDVAKTAVARCFTKNGVRGDLPDWNPIDKPWEDRIQEAVAEAFKVAFLGDSFRLYDNRSNWRISPDDWPLLISIMRWRLRSGAPRSELQTIYFGDPNQATYGLADRERGGIPPNAPSEHLVTIEYDEDPFTEAPLGDIPGTDESIDFAVQQPVASNNGTETPTPIPTTPEHPEPRTIYRMDRSFNVEFSSRALTEEGEVLLVLDFGAVPNWSAGVVEVMAGGVEVATTPVAEIAFNGEDWTGSNTPYEFADEPYPGTLPGSTHDGPFFRIRPDGPWAPGPVIIVPIRLEQRPQADVGHLFFNIILWCSQPGLNEKVVVRPSFFYPAPAPPSYPYEEPFIVAAPGPYGILRGGRMP